MLSRKNYYRQTPKKVYDLGCFHDANTDDGSSLEETAPAKFYIKEKSELCKKFMEKGSCPYGYKCKFAHGSQELRQNNSQNCKYKTKECQTFFMQSHCKYGERCNFIHSKKTPVLAPPVPSIASFLNSYPEMAVNLKTRRGPLSFSHSAPQPEF